MKLNYNREVMLNIIDKKPKNDLGKTAVMKMVFILQHVFNMSLGYSFDIYTYGPYAAEVSGELDALIYEGFIEADEYMFNNSLGYALKISEKGQASKGVLPFDDDEKISRVVNKFGKKKAKELELDSTIIFTRNRYIKNKWGDEKDEIIKDVHVIKPHFTTQAIRNAYDNLKNDGMLI